MQSLLLGVRMGAQKRWSGGTSTGPAVEYVIEVFKKAYSAAVSSRKLNLMAIEITRQAAIYNVACP